MTTANAAPKPHPNRVPFQGILTRLDIPSDHAPQGTSGHRVVLTTQAAEQGIDTLIGMGVGFSTNWIDHNQRQKCGIITAARVEPGVAIHVSGHLFCNDFPEVRKEIDKPGVQMGMSYELTDAHVEDLRADVWRFTQVTFTGAAILLSDKAAYPSTTFSIMASAEVFNGRVLAIGGEVHIGGCK